MLSFILDIFTLLIHLFMIIVICIASLIALFFILLALPRSRLRDFVLEIVSWTGMGVFLTTVITPIDFVPDFIPVIRQIDDIGYIVAALAYGIVAYIQRQKRINGS